MANEISFTEMKKDLKRRKINMRGLRIIEFILAIFMIVVVVWGLAVLALSIPWAASFSDYDQFHTMTEQILSDILLLVVGLELAGLLVHRKIELLVDIVLFVVARKMLISAHGSIEILLSVVALAGLFAVRKYLLICPGCDLVPDDSNKVG